MGPLADVRVEHLLAKLRKRLEAVESRFRPEIMAEPELRDLLARHLLFAEWTDLLADDDHSLSPAELAYHGYYWFRKLQKRFEARIGPDVGLEQQSFQLLERMPPGIDWNRVAEIDALALAEEDNDPNPPSRSGV